MFHIYVKVNCYKHFIFSILSIKKYLPVEQGRHGDLVCAPTLIDTDLKSPKEVLNLLVDHLTRLFACYLVNL